MRLAEIAVERRRPRIERDRPADELNRLPRVPLLQTRDPEQVQRVRVQRLLRQDGAVALGSLVQRTAAVLLQGAR